MIGMLSYLVHGYVESNLLTPDFILVLFIVSVLAGVWALATLVFYVKARHSGYFIALVDLCIFGALIGGVVALRGITSQDCGDITAFSRSYEGLSLVTFAYRLDQACALLKASFALGIIEIILFFNTVFLALWPPEKQWGRLKEW
ncbi:MAG: hypothetical protein M1831_005390 [Alyxoria varia]|nr:MAG: hypothetical protein M1831_005390 [Alyxoria varia]